MTAGRPTTRTRYRAADNRPAFSSGTRTAFTALQAHASVTLFPQCALCDECWGTTKYAKSTKKVGPLCSLCSPWFEPPLYEWDALSIVSVMLGAEPRWKLYHATNRPKQGFVIPLAERVGRPSQRPFCIRRVRFENAPLMLARV